MAVVASSYAFDQWQKDVFFSAAEEVQESADKMESIYRMWMRDRAQSDKSEIAGELRRDLQTALGTAKWQLEEFERAVNASYGNGSTKDNRITRHGQFMAAIRSQIERVEKSLGVSLMEEGEQSFRWVQLDDEERDDLANFLSAGPRSTQEPMIDKNVDVVTYSAKHIKPEFDKTVTINDDFRSSDKVEEEITKTKGKAFDKGASIDRQKRTWSSPDIGSWKIVIADKEDEEKNTSETRTIPPSHVSKISALTRSVGKTAKSKFRKNGFRKGKSGELLPLKNGISSYLDLPFVSRERSDSDERNMDIAKSHDISSIQQICGRIGGFRQHYHTQLSPSLRITLLLLLILFLFVPFVFYSN